LQATHQLRAQWHDDHEIDNARELHGRQSQQYDPLLGEIRCGLCASFLDAIQLLPPQATAVQANNSVALTQLRGLRQWSGSLLQFGTQNR
jgi:hypothetical protein